MNHDAAAAKPSSTATAEPCVERPSNTMTVEQRRRIQRNKWLALNRKFASSHQHLTAAQLEAIAWHCGRCLVTAGPGSGKTAVIAHRVGLLVAAGGVDSGVLALTLRDPPTHPTTSDSPLTTGT